VADELFDRLPSEFRFAHALALGAVLVSNDHVFARIKRLKVEDWAKAPRQ